MGEFTNPGVEQVIDGVTYTFKSLTFEDIEWLQLRLRAQAIEAGRMSIPSDVSPEVSSAMMQPILEHAQKIDFFECVDDMMNPIGMTWLLYRMCSPRPSMNLVSSWTKRKEILDELMPKVVPLLGFKKSEPKEKMKTKTKGKNH